MPQIQMELENNSDMEAAGSGSPLQIDEAGTVPDASKQSRQSIGSGDSDANPSSPTSNGPDGFPKLRSSDVNHPFTFTQPQDGYSSWSATSDKQLGYSSSGQNDRVFPIRSVVSVDPTQTPFTTPGRPSGEHEGFPGFTGTATGQDVTKQRQIGRKSSLSESETSQSNVKTPRKVTDPEHHPNITRPKDSRGYSDARRDRRESTAPTHADASGSRRLQIFNDATSEKSSNSKRTASIVSSGNSSAMQSKVPGDLESEGSIGGLVTSRFKHIVTEEGHAVITGRDGDTLQRCEDEPIHIPGAVQGFGLLIALTEESEGQLVVRIVSENSKRLIGYTPQELFRLSSFTDVLSEEQADNLLDHVDFIRDEEADPATNGPEVFTIVIRGPSRRGTKLWCAMHINPSNPETIICEFELDDDQMHPLVPIHEDQTPEPPEDTLHSNPTQEELMESTQNVSRPLRVLRSARKRKGEAAAMEVFNIMSQVQEQLASASNLEQFLKILIGVVKELTGFHRVMIYQFDSVFNGRVVAELIDPRATKDLYKGLNFPASDIPKQARDLYKINKVRLLYDRDLETARLVCRTVEDLENPLDLSFSYLRAMSPIHIKYLTNMAVRSSMSISINAFNELWGLIACHTYGSKGMRVSFPIRKMCRLVGDTASRNIERLSYASRLQARKLINTVPTEANPSGYIIASSDDLLRLFDADFGLLSIRGETKILGQLEQSQEALAMLEYLRLRKITSVITSQDIKIDFPDLRYPLGFDVIAGLLLVPLSVGGQDFIVFFRKGQVREVKWAGNPYEKFIKEGTEGYLEPRKSFKMWSETVVGKCREWTEEQVETAAVLCLVYGKFIEVWRQKEAALQSSQLTKLLLSNSAHEVRTPLNAIINYLEIALEGSLDTETRENLAKSHSASKSLIYVINDLLDLTKTEEGQNLVKDEIFDLPGTIRAATDDFKNDARRKGIDYQFIEYPGVPQFVHGDQQRVRQAVFNITANAVQNTSTGSVRVELWLAEREGRRVAVDIVIQDTGAGMSNQKLDALFRDLEQVTTADEDVSGLGADKDDPAKILPSEKAGRTLGLGLAVVARIVRNMEGQLRLKSEEGTGSRFVIQLPFDLPDETAEDNASSTAEKPSSISDGVHTPPPNIRDGELMLVDKASSLRESVARKRSVEDVHSIQSINSASSGKSGRSVKSDVDRLIDAISEPHLVGLPESEETRLQRSNSKGSGNSRRSAGSIGLGRGTARQDSMLGERPQLARSKSHGADLVPEHLRSAAAGPAGAEFVKDNKTLLKAVRMPDEFMSNEMSPQSAGGRSRVLFDFSPQEEEPKRQQKMAPSADNLQVLVAEDDPINSRIIIKRLEKIGHRVRHTVNGEECATAYGEEPSSFDVVLMDMQMPIVDGLTSTKMIRSFEKTRAQRQNSLQSVDKSRVPIFAVSASLVERERQVYIDAGFDGWILKPIDFKRLNTLLAGIVDDQLRNSCLYVAGEWERGGWFCKRQIDIFSADTRPSNEKPVNDRSQGNDFDTDGQSMVNSSKSTSSENSGELTPRQELFRPLIHDDRLDITDWILERQQSEGHGVAMPTVEEGKPS